MAILPRFYVYVLARPNNKPFYVGKGKGRRIYDHELEARGGHRCQKCNVIRKIWKQGGEVQRYIVFTTDIESDALAHEAELIALYGKSTLCNITDGGDSHAQAHETRAKIRAGMRLVHQQRTPEEKAKIAAKMGASKRGIKLTDEHRQKLSSVRKGRMPANIEVFKMSSLGKKRSADVRAANAQRHIGCSPSNKGTPVSPEKATKIALTRTGGRTYTITSPDGAVFRGVASLATFARGHHLARSVLHYAVRHTGKLQSGWQIVYE